MIQRAFTHGFVGQGANQILGDDVALGSLLAHNQGDKPFRDGSDQNPQGFDYPRKKFDGAAFSICEGDIVPNGQGLGGNLTDQ